MVKTLIVNCYLESTRISELYDAISKFSRCEIVEYSNVDFLEKVSKDVDAIVLSGSEARIVNPQHRERFSGVVGLIMDLEVPLFSICFGHQLLCWAFGAEPAALKEPVRNVFEDVRVIEVDEIFYGFREGDIIPLAEFHNDYVLKNSLGRAGFIILADSPSCEVEAVKHTHKPFYGVQFHPERIKIGERVEPSGHKIIQNFFKKVVRS